MRDFGVCEETVSHPRISLPEPGTGLKTIAANPARKAVRKIRVDGCVITEGLRCDWLLITPDAVERFVELKGSDVAHGIEQLEASIQQLSEQPRTQPKWAYLVSTRMPPHFLPALQTQFAVFKKRYNANLIRIRHEQEIPL